MQLCLGGENWNVIFKLPFFKKQTAQPKLEVQFILLYTMCALSRVAGNVGVVLFHPVMQVLGLSRVHEIMQLLQTKLMFLRWIAI